MAQPFTIFWRVLVACAAPPLLTISLFVAERRFAWPGSVAEVAIGTGGWAWIGVYAGMLVWTARLFRVRDAARGRAILAAMVAALALGVAAFGLFFRYGYSYA